jgi:hypothetical protein
MGDRRGALRNLIWRPEGRRQLGIPRHRWKDNIKIGQQKVGWELGMDCCGSG